MPTISCSRCSASEYRAKTDANKADSPGWTVVTISGTPIRNLRLCPNCQFVVNVVLDGGS